MEYRRVLPSNQSTPNRSGARGRVDPEKVRFDTGSVERTDAGHTPRAGARARMVACRPLWNGLLTNRTQQLCHKHIVTKDTIFQSIDGLHSSDEPVW